VAGRNLLVWVCCGERASAAKAGRISWPRSARLEVVPFPVGSHDVAQGLKPAFITDLYAALKRRSSTVRLAVAAREVVPFPYGACGIAKAMP